MEDAIGWLAQNILETLSAAELQAWIRRAELADDIDSLEWEVEMVDMVNAAVKERATGNKPLGRLLARLRDSLHDADDLVDELDYYSLLESSTATVAGRKDMPIQSTHTEHANYWLASSTTDSSDHAWSELGDISGPVLDHEKSRGDMNKPSSQRHRFRSEVWDDFQVGETNNAGGAVEAKCIRCGTVVSYKSKQGTGVLKNHINSRSCKNRAKLLNDRNNTLREQEDTFGAVRVDDKSREDIDMSRQGGQRRSSIWKHYRILETDGSNRTTKAQCLYCGSELNYGSKYGTSGLRRHLSSAGCRKKMEATGQLLLSSGDGADDVEAAAVDDSRSTKRMRMDDESTHKTKANTHPWNMTEFSNRIQKIAGQLQDTSGAVSKVLKLHGSEFVASSYHNRSTTSDQHLRTSCFLPRKVYGRDAEKDYIIKLMTEDKPDYISVLPIVGIGGVGKTTLAQFVYNDPTVKNHFDQMIWVSVSNNFDEVRLSREILDCVSRETHEGLYSFAKLQEVLRAHIGSKRILLIFDDVSDDINFYRWSQLLAPLQSNSAKGNVILLTTRKLSVAETVGTVEPIKLGGLAPEDLWQLFKSCAFGDENYERNRSLSIIGLQTAQKLKGNPLAAETAGQLLRRDLTIDHWNNILKNEDWKSLQLSGGIMPALKLSYDQLPYHSQQCFSHCSIFPEKYMFLGGELVHIWISQGLVKCDHSSKRVEEKGMDYLADLVNLGFFQQVEREAGSQTCYVMCGLMHDFAKLVSRTECATIDGLQCREMLPTIRHLSIVTDSGYSTDQHGNIPRNKKFEEKMFTVRTSVRKLRTLVLIGQYDSFFFKSFQDIIKEAHNLRLLQIASASADLNHLLCNLVNPTHLRYLKVDAAIESGALPQILSKFCRLQVLHVGSCNSPTIPVGIDNIVSLRHLVAEEGTWSSIANIGNLTSLQELSNFVVQNRSGFEITQLQSMKKLVQLGVSQLENVKTRKEAYEAGLRDKQHLERLHLSWKSAPSDDEYGSNMSSDRDLLSVEVLDGLEPPNNLKHLQISGYNGHISPTWLANGISVTSLQTLHMDGCGKLEILPPLEQLPFLRKLELMEMQSLTEVSIPSLEELVLIQLPKLERCSCISTGDLSSNLRVLMIERCPALNIFPLFESSDKFKIKQKSWLPSLRALIIHGCPNLVVPYTLPTSTISQLSIVDVSTLPKIQGSSGDTNNWIQK